MAPKTTSNTDIRDLIDKLRLEVKSDIGAVARDVKELGTKVDNIDKAQAVSSTKISMIVAGISIIVSAFVSTVVAGAKGKVL